MHGYFRYTNAALFIFSLIGMLMSLPVSVALAESGGIDPQRKIDLAALAVIFIWVMFALLLLSIYVPCEYQADESGVKIRCGLITRRFTYDNIRSVSARTYPDGHGRYGGTVYSAELRIVTDKGENRFKMYAGRFYTEDALRDPKALQERIDDNAFTHLAEYIQARVKSE